MPCPPEASRKGALRTRGDADASVLEKSMQQVGAVAGVGLWVANPSDVGSCLPNQGSSASSIPKIQPVRQQDPNLHGKIA